MCHVSINNKATLFSLFMVLVMCSANTIAMHLQWSKQPSMTETALIHSNITQQNYRIYISTPTYPAATSGYPIIYLLDGHLTFSVATSISQLLVKTRMISPIIIVGIDYNNENEGRKLRAADYTPAHNPKTVTQVLLKGEKNGGHAGHFLQFINNELKPVIEQKYPINKTQQALFGHSYGGLFTLYVLLNSPDSFNYYFAASPSIWWDDHIILKKLDSFIKHPVNTQSVSLIISVGELEEKITNKLPKERKEKLLQRKQVTNAKLFIDKLTTLNHSNIHSQFILLTDKNHATVIPIAIEYALLNFFHSPNASH